MKLYYSPGACSLAPHIVLREAGFDFTPVLASTKSKKLADGTDFLTINSKGQVPVLELDDGERLTEGPAIVQYLADLAPASGLAPANGTLARVRLQEWLNFISAELHRGFAPLFNPATPADYKPVVVANLEKKLDWLDSQLDGREFLLDTGFSVADAYLFTVSSWTAYIRMDLARWPHVAAHNARVRARPAVQAALRAEGLLK